MFKSSGAELNFTCNYELKYKEERSFGWKCVTPVQSYIDDLARQLGITAAVGRPSCDSVCSEVADRQLNYDDFLAVNITTLESFCQGQSHCAFNISVDFDFENQSWIRKDGTPIADLQWITSDLPRYKDIIVNHVDENRGGANWIGSSLQYRNLSGFYFCAGENVTSCNLKYDTYIHAKSQCHRISTLKICNDRSLTEQLINMIKSESNRSKAIAQAVYDFDFLFKPFRFWTGTKRLDKKRFVNEHGTIITSPYCPIKVDELCDMCSIEEQS